MPITKRPCSNCPFRCDDDAIELRPGRLESIIANLLQNDMRTFVCHKTLDTQRMTCAGAVAVMAKLGRLPVIARLGLVHEVITKADIEASKQLVIEPSDLNLKIERAGQGKISHGQSQAKRRALGKPPQWPVLRGQDHV